MTLSIILKSRAQSAVPVDWIENACFSEALIFGSSEQSARACAGYLNVCCFWNGKTGTILSRLSVGLKGVDFPSCYSRVNPGGRTTDCSLIAYVTKTKSQNS